MLKWTVHFGIIIGVFMLSACSSFGTRPDKSTAAEFVTSKQYNAEKGEFENRLPEVIAEMRKEAMSWGVVKDWLAGGKDRVPSQKLPEIKPNLKDFLTEEDEIKVIWFGHSSFLLNMQGKIVLVDPVFSNSASPVSFMVKRFQNPVLSIEELPPVDFVLISHDHYDHLDMESIKALKTTSAQFITPLGVGSHLQGWGIPKERIIEKDWWESHKVEGIEFIATPSQHFSGRGLFNQNETLWASWVIQAGNHKVYFSGDSGYDTHFKEIGDKYGPFDIAFIESGQYNKRWEAVHLLPEQGVQAYKDLNAKRYFPIHWGMFELSLHTWYEPIVNLYKKSIKGEVNLLAPKIGELVRVNRPHVLEKWWELQPAAVVQEPRLSMASY